MDIKRTVMDGTEIRVFDQESDPDTIRIQSEASEFWPQWVRLDFESVEFVRDALDRWLKERQ